MRCQAHDIEEPTLVNRTAVVNHWLRARRIRAHLLAVTFCKQVVSGRDCQQD
jgi:hypothetical protein